jgi:signal transduction histidine kinase
MRPDAPAALDERDAAEREALAAELLAARTELAVERARAQEADERSRATAETLREATVALTRSLDRETVLTTLLEHLRLLVPFDHASVMLLEEASRVSVRAVFDGERVKPFGPAERPEFSADDHPVLREIISTGAAVMISDTQALPHWSSPAGFAGESSWLGVPLFARGSVTGLLSVAKREVRYFNEEHMRLAEALSSQASVAVENAILFEQMQAATARMQDLSHRLVEVQENERRTVARELHDEAGQALVSLRFGLQLLERETGGGAGIAARVAELKQTTDAVIDSLHRLAAALRPPSLDLLGLDAALRQYLGSIEAKSGLAVRYKARGFAGGRLPPAIETALYRVVQEAVTNVLRHAGATRVDVLAERGEDRVLVVVEDNGIGFTPGGSAGAGRLGLVGMWERAEALGGRLTIESAPGAGTTVAVEVTL